MGNIFNQDFREFITSVNDSDVKYILAGGYSNRLRKAINPPVAYTHGHAR